MRIETRNPFKNQYGDKKQTPPWSFWSLGLVYFNRTLTINLLFWGVTFKWWPLPE